DASGFLKVYPTLQSISDPKVFGTGDCVAFDAYPELPRNGVYAVREGRVLFANVGRFLKEQPLRAFRPQRVYLSLMNTADGQAIWRDGPVHGKSRWAKQLKDRIDRRWMQSFAARGPTADTASAPEENYTMRCGGCG